MSTRAFVNGAEVTVKSASIWPKADPIRFSLDQVRAELGVKLPVQIELHTSLGQAKASYLGVCNGIHRIAVAVGKQALPKIGTLVCLPGLSRTVWHELTHALQCERDYDGDSAQARHHYDGEFARRLGIPKSRITQGYVHGLVRRELRTRGHSRTLDTYQGLPWEREAEAVADAHADIEVIFPVSRKMRRNAKR